MEEDSGRPPTKMGYLRRGPGVSLRNQSNEWPNHYSNKPGNTTKINPMKARWAENKEKPRYLREPFHSSSSKAASPGSSKSPVNKYYEEKQRRPFLAEAGNAESSNRRTEANRFWSSKKAVNEEDGHPYGQQTESEDSFSTSTTGGDQAAHEVLDSSVSSGVSPHAVDYTIRTTSFRTKPRRQKENDESSMGRPQRTSTFVHRSTVTRDSNIGLRSLNGSCAGVQRRGLKKLGCTSISDVLPSGRSSSNSVHNKRVEVMGKMTSDGECSSRSRGLSGQSSLGHPSFMYPGITGPRIREAEQLSPQQTIRTSIRNIQDSSDSVRTRRPSTQHTRARTQDEREGDMFALHETVTRVRQPDGVPFSLDDVPQQRLARPFSVELPHQIYSSNRQSSSNRAVRPSSHPEGSPPEMFHSLLGERDGYRRLDMEGIAEILQALDRIEQDDESTYEQLLVLETNLFLTGLGLHDQHRDMRMDIDNMSYEELLALEDRIGSVSTALSEEQFAMCLNQSVYRPITSELEVSRIVVDDVKCSICQEEYIEGEEVCRMQCDHQYHVSCFHEWLRQKNWCAICKASAVPSEMDQGDM